MSSIMKFTWSLCHPYRETPNTQLYQIQIVDGTKYTAEANSARLGNIAARRFHFSRRESSKYRKLN